MPEPINLAEAKQKKQWQHMTPTQRTEAEAFKEGYDEAYKQACEEGYKLGVQLERERWVAVLFNEAAQGRFQVARILLENPEPTAEQIIRVLETMPKETTAITATEPPKPKGMTAFEAAMAGLSDSNIGAGAIDIDADETYSPTAEAAQTVAIFNLYRGKTDKQDQ